ncbi:MAG: EamA family transporter [Planktomarina sp.]
MAWIWITLAAAAAQTLRFMVQKRLRLGTLSSAGATYARFVYAGPLIVAFALVYAQVQGGFPDRMPMFWVYATIGGISQILATVCLVSLFAMRHFSVGITLSKTEVIMTAGLGFVILGDALTGTALLAMMIGVVAVIVLSQTSGMRLTWATVVNRATVLGVSSGLLFGMSSTMYRGASQQVLAEDVLLRSSQTLMFVILIQSVLMTVYLLWFEKGQITSVFRAWRTAAWVGLLSVIGSLGWFTAFAMQKAAYVKALGQVEVIFSLIIAALVFKEKLSLREGIGIALMTVSILALVLAA